jgi:hypothetical protein
MARDQQGHLPHQVNGDVSWHQFVDPRLCFRAKTTTAPAVATKRHVFHNPAHEYGVVVRLYPFILNCPNKSRSDNTVSRAGAGNTITFPTAMVPPFELGTGDCRLHPSLHAG